MNREKKIIVDEKTGRKRVITINEEPSMTDQSQAPQCDVNNIIAKFQKTGEISHLAQHQGMYADVSEFQDLHTALSQVRAAEYAFQSLPGQLRARFENDPVKFVEFLQDPKNDVEAVQLGLKTLTKNPLYAPDQRDETNSTSSNTTQKNKASNDDD